MTEFENRLKDTLPQQQRDMEAGGIPDFDSVWAGAEARIAERRRRYRAVGGIAAAAAVVAVVAIGLMRPADVEWQYVNPDDFESSTSWVAPSDVLLPEHRFDIYGEIPVLIESTVSDEGALL
jgi:hypothetical protein